MMFNTITNPKISILTDPLTWGKELPKEGLKRIYIAIRNLLVKNHKYDRHPIYRGHFAVTKSLIQGLQNNSLPFNYNSFTPYELADTVIVLAGVQTLKQAIDLKKNGYIKKLCAGPNIVTFASDHNFLIASDEIDLVITPSQEVCNLYIEDCPDLSARCFAWPAGVDTDYWAPNKTTEREQILFYVKQQTGQEISTYANYVRNFGFKAVIVEYGSFTHDYFRETLRQSCLLIGFSRSESQGIAWAEAWSTDVPTLIWKHTTNTVQGRQYKCSTAPYLSPDTGMFFDDFEDFKKQFEKWKECPEMFAPRKWTLEHMSDSISAQILYEKVIQC